MLPCRTLYQKYKAEGFNLIAFPCNQFGGQAPGTSQEQREAAFAKFGFEFDVMDHIEARTLPPLSRRCRPLSGHSSQCIGAILVVHCIIFILSAPLDTAMNPWLNGMQT